MTTAVPFGYTIFCDDIRQEEGGKVTLVGVYSHFMYIHGSFPFSAPKFGLRIIYQERLKTLGKEQVVFRVTATWQENPLAEGPLPIQELIGRGFQGEMTDVAQPELGVIGMHLMFTPLVIPEPGVIKVRAFRGEHKVRLGSLRIGKAPSRPQESLVAPAAP